MFFEEGSENKRDNSREFDKDVQRRAGGVLEGIANGVTYNRGLVRLGVLAVGVFFYVI